MGRVTTEQGRQLYISQKGQISQTQKAGYRKVTSADQVQAYVSKKGTSVTYMRQQDFQAGRGIKKEKWQAISQKGLEQRRQVIEADYSKIKAQRESARLERREAAKARVQAEKQRQREAVVPKPKVVQRKEVRYIRESAPKAAPSIAIPETKVTATPIGAAPSTSQETRLTPEQQRDYGIITQKEYERSIGQRGIKPAAKKFIFGAAEVAEEIRIGREKSLKRTEAFAEFIPPPVAQPKTVGEGITSFGRAVGREVVGGVFSVVDIPVAGMEAALKGTAAVGSAVFFPETRKEVGVESKRAFKEGTIEELKRPEVIASAGIFAGLAGVAPKQSKKTVSPKPKSKPKPTAKDKPKVPTEKQKFTDPRFDRTTKEYSAIGETGARQAVTKSQFRDILAGKKAQARSPVGKGIERIDTIIRERRAKQRKATEKKTKEVAKKDKGKDIVEYKPPKPKARSEIIVSTGRGVRTKKSRTKDIIKTKPAKDLTIKTPKDITKTPAKDIIKPPGRDIIKTPEKKVPDIIRESPRTKPKTETKSKQKTLREKAKQKRRSAGWFDLPDLDLGGGGGGFRGFGRRKSVAKRKTGYKASIVAETFEIYGKPSTTSQFTGFEFRPLVKDEDKKKKRKKIY